jgi:class 3 adenylate cyclase/tetratricopeptide (TPR) repeat protein
LAPSAAKFCPACGTAIDPKPVRTPSVPPRLGEKILASRATVEGELKQVTALFCDIVRSTALAQRLGPEGVHVLLDRFFGHAARDVHQYEGTISQFLGDGFMALFGAPIAHEDHARRAVLAALGLREAVAADGRLEGMELRMGINSGEVVIGAIGKDLRIDYTAFGETTILAARLQAAAEPGEILLSQRTADLVSGYIEVEQGRPVQVKERTVQPWKVVRAGTRRSRLEGTGRRLSPFVGRARELAMLESLGPEDGAGRVIGIVGEPGIGKSRLIHEFRAAIGDASTVHVGRCLSFGAATPYLPVLDLLHDTSGIGADDDRVAAAAKLRATLSRAGTQAETALPFLLHLLGDPGGSTRLADLDPATIKGRTFEVLRDLWLGIGEHAPLVLLVEDLHWVDPTSEEFLSGFADDLPSSGVVLLTTYRPGYTPPWTGRSYATQLALSPLSPAAGRELVRSTSELPDDVTQQIIARAEGNPFFLEELARIAVEVGTAGTVPQTVTEVLAARIDRLGKDPKRVIQSASVLGREFTLPLLEALLPREVAASESLQELKELELLFERRGGGDRAFVFKHALTQAVAYEGLLESRRRELHARAGRALEVLAPDRLDERCELLAHHYSRSDDREKAAEYLILANRRAAARNAMDEALGYFHEALPALDDLPDTRENRIRKVALVLDQTAEFHFLHRHREYYDLLRRQEQLVLELDDDSLLASYLARIGHRECTFGEYPRADVTMRRAAELCERTANVDAAGVYGYLGWNCHQLGDYASAHEHFSKARTKLEQQYHPIWYQYARGGAIVSHGLAGRWDDAARDVDAMVAEAGARSEMASVSFAYSMGAFAFVQQRDWERVTRYSQLGLTDAPTIYFQSFPQTFLAAAACATGRIEEGLPVLEFIIPLLQQSEHRLAWTLLGTTLSQAYATAGRTEDARALLEDILACGERGRALFVIAQTNRMLGELDAAAGRIHDATARFDRAIKAAEASGSENELALALAGRGRITNGHPGRSDLERALATLERLGTCVEPDRVRADLAAMPVER